MTDPRTYVERIFFNFADGRMVPKQVSVVDCSDGIPDLPADQVFILENYKKNKQRGRKDKLEGKTVIMFPTDKKPLMLPLDEALTAADSLHSYLTSVFRSYSLPVEAE